ncbi:MAG: hypothetical protein GY699_14370 [Desulfobacteraceae bacterium]|nr:hypothetical protein [Desulfobacteraceae bacterium]
MINLKGIEDEKNTISRNYSLVLFLGIAGVSQAALSIIGTATCSGNSFNLIYDSDGPLGPITWLDYTNHTIVNWITMNYWAASLNTPEVIQYNLNPGVTMNWGGDWRLPDQIGYGGYVTTSEMGRLYFTELGNPAGGPMTNYGPFSNLTNSYYWGNSRPTHSEGNGWATRMDTGHTDAYEDHNYMIGLAVRPGQLVPVPGAFWLLGSGLIGFLGFRRRYNN